VYYPSSSDECIMFWKPLMTMNRKTKLFKILQNAIWLLQYLGFDNVTSNNRMDLSLFQIYNSGGDHYDQIIEYVKEDCPDELFEKANRIKDEKKRNKRKDDIAEKWAASILEKEHEHMQKVEEFWNNYLECGRPQAPKQRVDFDLLEKAVTEYRRSDTDISAWLSHLLMLYKQGFRFNDFIVYEDHEEMWPVIPDHCIGLEYDTDNWMYMHHDKDVQGYADQYGYFPLASITEVYPGRKNIVTNDESVPIASWTHKALRFNLSTLKY
jgi:hypothetical protein